MEYVKIGSFESPVLIRFWLEFCQINEVKHGLNEENKIIYLTV